MQKREHWTQDKNLTHIRTAYTLQTSSTYNVQPTSTEANTRIEQADKENSSHFWKRNDIHTAHWNRCTPQCVLALVHVRLFVSLLQLPHIAKKRRNFRNFWGTLSKRIEKTRTMANGKKKSVQLNWVYLYTRREYLYDLYILPEMVCKLIECLYLLPVAMLVCVLRFFDIFYVFFEVTLFSLNCF